VIEITGGVDELGDFLRAEDDGQSPGRLGKGNVLGKKMAAQCLTNRKRNADTYWLTVAGVSFLI
jgi:hypothetical protein